MEAPRPGRIPRGRIAAADLARLAALNLRRHGLRSAVNTAGIAIAVASLVFFLGFYRGTYEHIMFASVIDYSTANVQIQSEAFDEDQSDLWTSPPALMDEAEAAERLPAGPGLESRTARLQSAAFAGNGARKASVLLAGADFEAEKETFRLSARIAEGSFGPSGAVIGKSLARALDVGIGDELRVQASASDGSPNLDFWTVAGIFSSGYPSLDRGLVLVPLREAQVFLGAEGKVNKLYLRSSDRGEGEKRLAAARDALAGSGLSARPWEDYARAIVDDARKDSFFFAIFIAILLFLSLSTVAGTMRVTVYERKREIGMLRASGWTRREIFVLFLLEACAMGALGALAGSVLGGGAAIALQIHPVSLGDSMGNFDIPSFSLACRTAFSDFVLAAAAGLSAALAAGLSPARAASRLPIASALSER